MASTTVRAGREELEAKKRPGLGVVFETAMIER
jgi:hypothetical protein